MNYALGVARALVCLMALSVSAEGSSAQDPDVGPPVFVPPVVKVDVEGNSRWTEEQIVSALGQPIGDPFNPLMIEAGLERLWRALKVRAEVLKQEVDGGLRLVVRVTELPVDLEPRFVGNDGVGIEKLLEWAGLTETSELYLHQVSRVRQRLVENYKREGYHFIQVDPLVKDDVVGDGLTGDVIFRIIEGPQVYVDGYEIRGNESLPDRGALFWKDGLSKLADLQLHGPRLFTPYGATFSAELLDADLIALRQVYRDNGFLDAVVELEELDFNEDRSRVLLRVVVDEGPQYRVASLEIEGVEFVKNPVAPGARSTERPTALFFDEEELLALCSLTPGSVFDQVAVNADQRALRDYYGKRGYLSHSSLVQEESWNFLEPDLAYDPERAEVRVKYKLAQGREYWIREVRFGGAYHTRDRILRREVTVLPGQRADLREIYQSLRRITSTGFFSNDRDPLNHREPTFRFVPTEREDQIDVEFLVEEGRVVDAQLMGGVDSNDGLFGIVSLTMRNFDLTDLPSSFSDMFGEIYRKEAFHGAGQQLNIHISPGSEVSYSNVRFLEPDLFKTHYDRWILDLEYSDRDRVYRDYDEGRRRSTFEVGRQITTELNLYAGFEQQDVSVEDRDIGGVIPPALASQDAETELSGLLLNLRYRDLDRRINPSDGVHLRWLNSIYSTALGGSEEFAKTHLFYDWYKPVGADELGDDPNSSVHVRIGAGYAKAFGESDSVPYTERFFLGGYKTLRGFDFRGVGPNEGEAPLGGESLLNLSLEYRMPLYSTTRPGTFDKVEMFRLILFTDAGVLGPEDGELDFDEVRASAGFGLGLTYPFPVVFNFGFPLEEGPGDRTEVFSFSIAL
ncbi:MAG: BamA/TamA family outer membrane protein [Planctomycetes bacterium]|nr:BamA/TamA family outer membrane protein [Planctomycetota bacterium]